jgi:hypothetical protein
MYCCHEIKECKCCSEPPAIWEIDVGVLQSRGIINYLGNDVRCIGRADGYPLGPIAFNSYFIQDLMNDFRAIDLLESWLINDLWRIVASFCVFPDNMKSIWKECHAINLGPPMDLAKAAKLNHHKSLHNIGSAARWKIITACTAHIHHCAATIHSSIFDWTTSEEIKRLEHFGIHLDRFALRDHIVSTYPIESSRGLDFLYKGYYITTRHS